ncbi:BlaI/MecI/CopY family transcriptional regulator, partial [Acinetobacter baumannii]|nr:BlaI/MecI/CopY family transcriptional regulator [Acinetobacter baumannii]
RYKAVLTRREYLPVESRSALGRMFAGSARNLVAAMAETHDLTDADIDELADYLADLKKRHAAD